MKCKLDIENNKTNSKINTTRNSPISMPSGTTNSMISESNVRDSKANFRKDTETNKNKPDST